MSQTCDFMSQICDFMLIKSQICDFIGMPDDWGISTTPVRPAQKLRSQAFDSSLL